MDHQWTNEELTDVIDELCRRTAVDPDFRQLALTRPKAAMAKVTTKPLPAGITYKFVDNSGSIRTIPLPEPMPETDELSDIDLEKIAGGNWTTTGP
jgi:hypothetical protein